MKPSLLLFLRSFVRKHVIALTVALLAAALAAGVWYGWRYYQYRQSSDFAYARFRDALQPPNPEKLAVLVDFNTLSGEMAEALAKTFPFFKKGPDQIRDLKNTVQMGLLKKLLSKEEPKSDAAAETDPQKLLQQPLSVLPADFLSQFLNGLGMQPAEGGTALISTNIRHPLLNQTFPVILRMEKSAGGWIIRNLLNADELARQFRQALLTRIAARLHLFKEKNKSIQRRMDAICPCSPAPQAQVCCQTAKHSCLWRMCWPAIRAPSQSKIPTWKRCSVVLTEKYCCNAFLMPLYPWPRARI